MHKIEILCGGQQVIVAGVHPDTGEPYTWHNGTPWERPSRRARRGHRADMEAYLELATERLAEECGFKRIYHQRARRRA